MQAGLTDCAQLFSSGALALFLGTAAFDRGQVAGWPATLPQERGFGDMGRALRGLPVLVQSEVAFRSRTTRGTAALPARGSPASTPLTVPGGHRRPGGVPGDPSARWIAEPFATSPAQDHIRCKPRHRAGGLTRVLDRARHGREVRMAHDQVAGVLVGEGLAAKRAGRPGTRVGESHGSYLAGSAAWPGRAL